MKTINLEKPQDVAPIVTENKSLNLVLIFSNFEKAELFHQALIFNHDIGLQVIKEDSGTFTFIFESSNSPLATVIPTKRTIDNNPTLKFITDKNFKDYVYLTFGYKNGQQVMYNQSHSYPVSLTYPN